MKKGLYATINVGSSAVRMSVISLKGSDYKEIDYLVKPLAIGMDIFYKGYITLENVQKLVEIFLLFKVKIEEYNIANYKVICTSEVKDANNKDFFIDYIRIHTGFDMKILDPSEEIYVKYVGTKYEFEEFGKIEKGGVIVVTIASGNISINILKQGKIIHSGVLAAGTLKLRSMFANISSVKRYKAYDQYISNLTRELKTIIATNKGIKSLIGGGSSINLLIRVFKPKKDIIHKKDIVDLYKKVKSYSRKELMEDLSLREDESIVIIPTLSAYIHLLELVEQDYLYFSRSSFPFTLARFYSGNIKDRDRDKRVKSTLLLIAKRYNTDVNHAERVAKYALKLYHFLEELHSLNSNEDRVLERSAFIHDVGSFIGKENIARNSYSIISSLNIPGLDNQTVGFMASIVYQMLKLPIDDKLNIFTECSTADFLVIKKLASLLGIAKALDVSKVGLIRDFNVKIRSNMILVEAFSTKEPFLELLAFDRQKDIFMKTFGVPIDIRIRVSYE